MWNKLINLGTSKTDENELHILKIYNVLSFSTLIVCILIAVIGYFHVYDTLIFSLILSLIVCFFLCLVLNAIGKLYWSKLCVTIVVPVIISSLTVLFGSANGQILLILGIIAIAFISFQNNSQFFKRLMIFICGVYTLALFYINQSGPIFEKVIMPYSEILTFYLVCGWISFIFLHLRKKQENLIAELRTQNKKLKQASDEMDRFTYIASHDLKTPLTTIFSFTELLEKDIEANDMSNLEQYLGYIKTGTNQMNFLIEDILELYKVESFNESSHTWLDLSKTLEVAQENLIQEIEKKDAKILISNKLPMYFGNEVEFVILFQNLIQNGIKYNTNDTPTVWINSKEDVAGINLIFKDNGIGINENYHKEVFKFFKRLHNKTIYQGTGVGLGLCNRIVLGYEGTISLDSEEEKGSTFTVSLPIVKTD